MTYRGATDQLVLVAIIDGHFRFIVYDELQVAMKEKDVEWVVLLIGKEREVIETKECKVAKIREFRVKYNSNSILTHRSILSDFRCTNSVLSNYIQDRSLKFIQITFYKG